MGTFAAGFFLDPHTGRPVAAQTVQVVEYPTDVPVTPDDGPLATGALGGYGRFTVTDVDAVTLVGSSGARVDLVSIEKQLAGIVTYTKAEIDALVAQSGTSGSGVTPDPDYPGLYRIGGGGAPVDYPPTITLGASTDGLDVTATFTASDPEGAPVTVKIAWGDGQTTDPATSPVTHTYGSGGTYTITATATAGGRTGTDSTPVTVAAAGNYTSSVLADAPVVYIPFTETTRPFLDTQGVVTLTNIGVGGEEAIPGGMALGTIPRSAEFNISGGSDFPTYATGPITLGSSASVELVFRPYTLQSYLIGGLTVEHRIDGSIRIWNGSGWAASAAGAIQTGGPIYHVAVTWTPTLAKIYVNAVEVVSAAGTYNPASVSWSIGGKPTTPTVIEAMRGWLAGVAFYDKALTPTQVSAHHDALGL